ncbi:hypothetical protein F2Q69_00048654 [Brassica cretica]|uniref:Uncharacterized protein n=1 Tax=Brassica cretica TaxID=69181 RepID=A0A8S9Q5J5_BRACR|nr:hypothetical protein F2Q69_00048654 [Brassica cretica]
MISYISVLDGGILKFFQDLFRSRNQWVVERLWYQDFCLVAFTVVLRTMCDLYCALPYEFPYSVIAGEDGEWGGSEIVWRCVFVTPDIEIASGSNESTRSSDYTISHIPEK